MTKFWTKIKSWFRLKSAKKKPVSRQKLRQANSTAKSPTHQPINHKHYRKLIGKIAKKAIAIQRARQRRNC